MRICTLGVLTRQQMCYKKAEKVPPRPSTSSRGRHAGDETAEGRARSTEAPRSAVCGDLPACNSLTCNRRGSPIPRPGGGREKREKREAGKEAWGGQILPPCTERRPDRYAPVDTKFLPPLGI